MLAIAPRESASENAATHGLRGTTERRARLTEAGPRLDWTVFEEPPQVVGQGRRGTVAMCRFRRGQFADDRSQVARDVRVKLAE